MYDYDPKKKKLSTDWSGTIIGAMVLPIFFIFVYLGKPEIGFNLAIILGMAILAVKFRWKQRKYIWFWSTIILVVLLHIPLMFLVHWPQTNVPTIAYSFPLGAVDFYLISGALALAERLFNRKVPVDYRSGDGADGKE